MKKIKRILSLITIIFLTNTILTGCSKKDISTVATQKKLAKIAVFLADFTNDFILEIRQSLEDIQKRNPGKVEYTFYDSESNQAIQNEELDRVLKEGTDLILLNIVNRGEAKVFINKIKDYNIPVILFDREPLTPVPIQAYNRALYIGTDSSQAGQLQGEMLIDAWKTSRQIIDKNEDKIMQYVMLEGESDNSQAIQRTKYSVIAIEKAGIKTQQVALEICDWNEKLAYNAIKLLLEKYKDQIEVIISNDDTMAIGAIKALQENGYNVGDKSNTIPIVGVDVTSEAKEYIEKRYMLGSVYQDPKAYAEALYACGMNLINFKSPIEGTKYTLDDTRVSIRIPHTDYLYKNIFVE